MKILIINNSSGGLYNFRRQLIKELVDRGNQVKLLIPFNSRLNELKEIGTELIETPIERRSLNPFGDYSLYKLYSSIIKEEKPDLIITYTIKPNIYAGRIAAKKNIPYATNITGLGTAFESGSALKYIAIKMYKTALKKAKVVFFENRENCNTFLKLGIVNEKQYCVLPGAGVDIDYFSYQTYPEIIDNTNFIFIGRVMKEKGIDELFSAVRRLYLEGVRCRLTVLGGCEEHYEEEMRKYSSEGWMEYLGHQLDVREYIKQSHCFVLPSWHEGMANTNLECAAMGRPIITSNIPGCMEAVDNGVSGFLCEKQNADDLYQKLKHFISLPYDKQKAMGLAGRKRMEEIFDKKKVIEQTIERL